MSVLAWDGRLLATDRQITSGSTIATSMRKQQRHGDELLGYVGSAAASIAMRDWCIDGAAVAQFPKIKPEVTAVLVVVHADGTLSEYSAEPFAIRYDAGQPFAVGSGEAAALAAMRCGKSAEEAVRIACEVDIYCGGGVDVSVLREGVR